MVNDVAPLSGYPEPYGLLCAILQDTTVEWRGEIGSDLGSEITTWRVRPGGQTIGALMLHIVIVELFWFEEFVLGQEVDPEDKKLLLWNEIDVDLGAWPDPPAQPLSWYFALHDRYRARTLESIKRWPSAETLISHDDRPRSLRWVLGHVIQHEAYHGGQIVMLHDLWMNRAT